MNARDSFRFYHLRDCERDGVAAVDEKLVPDDNILPPDHARHHHLSVERHDAERPNNVPRDAQAVRCLVTLRSG